MLTPDVWLLDRDWGTDDKNNKNLISVVGRCIPSVFVDGLDYAATMATTGGTNLESKDGTAITGDVLNTASQ